MHRCYAYLRHKLHCHQCKPALESLLAHTSASQHCGHDNAKSTTSLHFKLPLNVLSSDAGDISGPQVCLQDEHILWMASHSWLDHLC